MTPERSRCLRSITTLMEAGTALSKHDAAKKIHCDVRTAERVLSHLWHEEMIRIVSWERVYNNPTPRYRWGSGEDAPRPLPMSPAEKSRKQREKPGVQERHNFNRRLKRSLGRKVRLGLWGL